MKTQTIVNVFVLGYNYLTPLARRFRLEEFKTLHGYQDTTEITYDVCQNICQYDSQNLGNISVNMLKAIHETAPIKVDLSSDVICYMLANHYEVESADIWNARAKAIRDNFYEDGTSLTDVWKTPTTDSTVTTDLPDYI